MTPTTITLSLRRNDHLEPRVAFHTNSASVELASFHSSSPVAFISASPSIDLSNSSNLSPSRAVPSIDIAVVTDKQEEVSTIEEETTAAERLPYGVSTYHSPSSTLQAVAISGTTRANMEIWKACLLGFNSGVFLSCSNLAATVIAGGLSASIPTLDTTGNIVMLPANPIYAKIAYGAIFPLGLILICLTGGELFTGNILFFTSACTTGRIRTRATILRMLRNLFLVYWFNFLGSLFVAYFLAYLPELVHSAPQSTWLAGFAMRKMATTWGQTFLKAIGCNMMVCLAIWSSYTTEDVMSKIAAIWFPIAAFVYIGWEHSVANMFLLPLALMEGVPGKDTSDFIVWNLIPVTLGNVVGGLLFALGQYGGWRANTEAAIATSSIRRKSHV